MCTLLLQAEVNDTTVSSVIVSSPVEQTATNLPMSLNLTGLTPAVNYSISVCGKRKNVRMHIREPHLGRCKITLLLIR